MERWEAKSIVFRKIPQPSALVVSLALENGNKNGKKEEAKNKKHIHNTYKHIVYCVSNPQIKTQSCLNVQSFRDTSQYELFIIYRKSQSGRWASKRVQETNKQTVLVLVFAFAFVLFHCLSHSVSQTICFLISFGILFSFRLNFMTG